MIGLLSLGIGAPIAADKMRKSWLEAKPIIENLSNQLDPLISPTTMVLKATALIGLSTAFAQVAAGICAFVNTFSGISAQKELLKVYTKLGADVEAIKTSIAEISQSVETLVNFENQHKFAKHIYDWVRMRSDEEEATSSHPVYFFVYHRGDEWRPKFHTLNCAQPLPKLCGIFHNLSVMAVFLTELRRHVEPDAVFHVLMPATELFFIADAVSIPVEIGPLCLEGEIHNQSGLPYVHVNMPEAADDLLRNIHNVGKPTVMDKKSRGWGRWLASTSAAWAAGLPAGMVAAPGGAIVGVAGGCALAVLCPPLEVALLLGGTLVGTAAAGAGVGTTCALHVGSKVERAWDASEAKKHVLTRV
ncbi:hypothetical protein LTR10_010698 [Elasticomyces elasticus]|nr:hypothetical protein LTR10_010698 [Elasticomyces elasticus]KAK4968304.1 hypothetical protein LTR42_009587 [Elasticomyces elasticus]